MFFVFFVPVISVVALAPVLCVVSAFLVVPVLCVAPED